MVWGNQQSFLIDTRWVQKIVEIADPCREDVVFLLGGGNGQLASALDCASKIVTVEPDESIANYLYSLELYKTMVINAEPHLVLGDFPFDKVMCLHPWHVSEAVLQGLLRVNFSQAVMVMPDDLISRFRGRDQLGMMLRASFDLDVKHKVPKTAFAPEIEFSSSLVVMNRPVRKDPVAKSLQLLLLEAGTMRGLLTRSCREFFGYMLAEAQEAVKLLDKDLLRKRFWEISEVEFKEVYDWLKLG